MNKKIGTIGILILILMLFPIMGYKIFNDRQYEGNTTNAQDTPAVEDLRGVWIASVNNINFPSKPGLTAEEQMKELDKIIENTKYMGLNAIFFQVRPTGDALYKSSIFPWSAYLTGEQGKANDRNFDPLEYIIEQGHKNGIQIHAWINPLRLSMGTTKKPDKDVKVLSENHPARKISNAVVSANTGQLYLDPGCPEAVKLITEGVAEIVRNYDIDGIHFDDYFYPSKTEAANKQDFNDDETYKKYKGGFKNKDDWRRNNIDTLIRSTYDTVKGIKPEVQFGVSPFAIWSNKDRNKDGSDTQGGISTYYDYFADSRKWVKEEYLDYIAPQIYWNIGFKIADYSVLLDWWKNVCAGTNVKLYVGHAAYKINDTSQANEWLDPLQIPKQIALNRESKAVSGSIYYGYAKLESNALGIKEKLHGIYSAGRDPGSSVPEDRQLIISSPANGYETSSSKISLLGSCDPDQPVYLEDTLVETSDNGYFTVYADLKDGENSFVFKHKGNQTIIKIKKKAAAVSTAYTMNKPEFKPGSFLPVQSMTMRTGRKVTFSCQAPKGAKVWVEIGKYKVDLTGTEGSSSSEGTLTPVKYTGTFTFPAVSGNQRVMSLGNPVFVLDYNGKKVTSKQSNTISVQSSKYNKYAVVSTSEAEAPARSGPSTSYSRVTPLINGASDYVEGQQNNFYLLKSGMWVSASDVKIVNDKAIKTNNISSIKVTANAGYTDLTFKMPVNAVFDVSAASDRVTLTLYNTKGIKIGSPAPGSSIYSSAVCRNASGNAEYTFKLKKPDSFYGYYVQYKNGSLVFSLKNGPKIAKTGTKPLSGLKVLLDAGHGGKETGAIGPAGKNGLYEKDINLSIALNTRKYLKALGAEVIMTRTSDTTVSLSERADMIRNKKPDIAVSIHNNSMDVTADYTKHTGLLTLYSRDSSKAAAGFIQKALTADLQRKDGGYRWQSLSVCIPVQAPAILIECGFMSNPAEYEWLVNYENQVKIADSIGKAVESWAYNNAR
ncbi:uncharacterized lipoprotein YddW (UPF0748 family) [Ruminiclostridium sufflavum DSM 19573]|uniref:Uncharacterized lipoprotein YddW (UPF0748 family) n=1 Tax=Ruminiclostridium sufflavum DSM 19573 TaxID=1121337 RepID=A0A318XI89_9FIRM|nr:N-acetylmuramoyl-L-alanine amidase [Ruminiclostridium sufflavum]PYG86905.1 uncharacterized lipoprotein YddW (UPF0748 family) [Ruminiclostridium sufflavum DSM 19573]